METIISQLFSARDTAHRLHLKTKSFSAHMALGDLYTALIEFADGLTEIYQGQFGILEIPPDVSSFSDSSALEFIKELAEWAENQKENLPQQSHILNEWDTLVSTIFRAKYKLENLA